jgi:hypothetical protein
MDVSWNFRDAVVTVSLSLLRLQVLALSPSPALFEGTVW